MSASWNAVGASVRGTSHLKTALPCQDACAYMTLPSGIWIAAVSDGAGSAARADLGAQQAVNQAIYALRSHLEREIPESDQEWFDLLANAFEHTRASVLDLPAMEGGDTRDYACTLTLVIASPEWLVTGQIGDGLVVAEDENGVLHVAAEPQRGEYADATFFLTQQEAPELFSGRVRRLGQDLPPVSALAVMTDGLIHLAIDRTTKTPHGPFFRPLMRVPSALDSSENALAGLIDFLTSERINQRTTDDKTLVLAGLAPG